ncbi:Non-heme 11 kDa protein of cytochrome bc1 complex [Mycena floridula]|nr:Non-heme 11 kDa protein of cytochrome bc1 complex [Mycena floridula]
MGLVDFFSSFTTVHADSEPEEAPKTEEKPEEAEAAPAEEEEEEPEDVHPLIREECKESSKCVSLAKHFEHCQEKVTAGQGFKGEDCVEELCAYCPVLFCIFDLLSVVDFVELVHMMHCVENCAAPKLFDKLK